MNHNQKLKSILLIATLLFCSLVSSQNIQYKQWKILYQKAVEAIGQEDYNSSKIHLENANKISEKFTDDYMDDKSETQFLLGKTYAALKMYKEAFPLLKNAVLLTEKSKGKLHTTYSERSSYLGSVYDAATLYEEALEYYKESLNLMEANGRNSDPLYAAELSRVGNIYRIKGDYYLAEKTLNQSLKIFENSVGKGHMDYGMTLSSLSIVQKKRGEFKAAISSAEKAIEVIKMNVGTQDPEYATSMTNLTQIYSEIGEYEKAIKLQEEVLKLSDSTYRTTINYAGALFTLSTFYHEIEEYEREVGILKEVRVRLPVESRYQTNVDNNLSRAYDRMGDYEMALIHIKKSLKNTPRDHENYGTRLQNIAFMYEKLGEYEKALETYDDAILSIENKYGKSHLLYGKALNNLGKLQFRLGNYEQAKLLFAEALTNFLAKQDENHPKYGYYLNDYAKTLLELGQHEEAINLMKDNLRLADKNSNTESEAYFNRQYELAKAYNSLDRFNEALPLLENATKNLKLKLGIEHADYGKMIKTLGESYVGNGNLEEAYPYMVTANEVNFTQLDKIFKFRSENEKKSFLKVISNNFDDLQTIPIQTDSNSDIWNELNLNNQLMLKGLLLNNSKDVLTQLGTLDDATIKMSIENYKLQKRLLAKTLNQSVDEREMDVDSLKEVVNLEESKLVKLHSEAFGEMFNLKKDWKLSQSKLSKNDIGIEFSSFRLTVNRKATDSVMYVAYVYKRDSKHPILVRLFEEKQLKKVLHKVKPNDLYNSNELYELIWKPLEASIKKSKTIYFAPSGLLNQIQFAAIKNPKSTTLGQLYDLVQLSSTSILASKTTEPIAKETLFIGGIDYETANTLIDEESMDATEKGVFDNVLKNERATTSRGESWTYLEGTLNEINNLQNILNEHEKPYKVLKNQQATETNFKAISGNSPSILHIATHGYFYENLKVGNAHRYNLSTEDQYRLAEDPLLRSGLILAGANDTWKNGRNSSMIDDGILTAMEISNLDLSNTEMVVLSACETGLGDIDGSEGVYGLQRAFKMAGVNIIVMSLWRVPDDETAEFMNLFYSSWMKGNKVRKAFNAAQRTMQKKYANEPLKWAAFVLFE